VITKGVLTFDDTNTCTSTTATTGCAFQTVPSLPAGFASAGRIDADVAFTSTDVTNGHTIIWKLSTKCVTPSTDGTGTTDDPATLNAADTLTFTVGASAVSASARHVSMNSITTTGCNAGDILHVRIGRDVSDTATTSVNLIGVTFTIYRTT